MYPTCFNFYRELNNAVLHLEQLTSLTVFIYYRKRYRKGAVTMAYLKVFLNVDHVKGWPGQFSWYHVHVASVLSKYSVLIIANPSERYINGVVKYKWYFYL